MHLQPFQKLVILTGIIILLLIGINGIFPSIATAQGFSCVSVTEIPQSECEALVALYNATNGSGWLDSTNWLQNNQPSTWYGVDINQNTVTGLYLDHNQLIGQIPSELNGTNLPNLQLLQLNDNQIFGQIPSSFAFPNLTYLALFHNQFSGSIPSTLNGSNLPKLKSLFLSGNQFSGDIPVSLASLSTLTGLNLVGNQLTGGIPLEFNGSNLPNLAGLSLYDNQLSGSIPPEIGSLSELQSLKLQINNFTGSLPLQLQYLSNLQQLYFDGLDFGGNPFLCVPDNESFQTWLSGVDTLPAQSDWVICEGGPSKPPLVLVHGIQIASSDGYDCNQGIQRYTSSPNNSTLGDIAGWLSEDYDVWIAHLSSNRFGTPSLQENARCLEEQVRNVYNNTGQQKVVIVAHSMGGIVSRVCLSMGCRDKTVALYTLGSPHAGLRAGDGKWLKPLVWLLKGGQTPIFQLSNNSMRSYNSFYRNQPGIKYTFIGGDANPAGALSQYLYGTEGINDGLIGRYSAIGWDYPNKVFNPPNWGSASPPTQYWTDETHVDNWGYAYYEGRPQSKGGSTGNRSQSYGCIAFQEKLSGYTTKPTFCNEAISVADLSAADTPPTLSETTVSQEGHLASYQVSTHTVQVDTTGHSLFYLSWITGTVSFSLTQPGGQVIDPAYVTTYPDQVAYNMFSGNPEFPPIATYAFTNTQTGLWTLSISTGDVGTDGTDYLAFVAMETSRTFSVTANTDLYNAGDTATFTATLQGDSGGIGGGTVTATLRRPDNVTDTLTFTEQGGGIYKTTYTIPNTPGYIATSVKARGNDGGTPFTRQDDTLITVASAAAQLSGQYADYPQDADGNHLYEELIFEVNVTATQVGTYTISANLAKGSTLIANTMAHTVLPTGAQTITLRFNGDDIRNGGLDGPYTVSNLIVNDLQNGAVPAILATDIWTTAAYQYSQFGSSYEKVYLPIILK